MAQLRQDFEQFVAHDLAILIIGPENPEKFAAYFSENQLPFIGLPDPKHQVLKQYGKEVNLFKLGRMPAQVLVDKEGIARFVHYGKSMSDIPSNEELLALAENINKVAKLETQTITE